MELRPVPAPARAVELEERRERRLHRYRRECRLPLEKTIATLELEKTAGEVRRSLPVLTAGGFVDRAENLLVLGLPGRAKTHVVCAIGHELIASGRRVLFTATSLLVQRLLSGKRDLRLERELRELDKFDAVILDDLGCVQQDRSEMEVLFTFLAERYERKSIIIPSNLAFSEWERIFQDPMTAAAAIDRLVHHSIILEMTQESYRNEEARQRLAAANPPDRVGA